MWNKFSVSKTEAPPRFSIRLVFQYINTVLQYLLMKHLQIFDIISSLQCFVVLTYVYVYYVSWTLLTPINVEHCNAITPIIMRRRSFPFPVSFRSKTLNPLNVKLRIVYKYLQDNKFMKMWFLYRCILNDLVYVILE